jgi:single-stranded DNA-binding protein
MFVTGAVISKGYNDAPALKFSENAENPNQSSVRFRIGVRVYDKRAENNHRYVNIGVKAFGYLVERVKGMKLDAGTYVNITGRYDEESWEDQTTREKKNAPVLIADEIEFSHNSGNGGNNGNGSNNSNDNGSGNSRSSKGNKNSGAAAATSAATRKKTSSGEEAGQPDGFTGFEGFGEPNPYY